MRNISFALTTRQFLDGTKTVTRRLGWKNLKAGARLMAVEKSQGLKSGESVVKLGEIEIVSVRREPLSAITEDDVDREGFPELTAGGFIEMFLAHMGLSDEAAEVTRIEFRKERNK